MWLECLVDRSWIGHLWPPNAVCVEAAQRITQCSIRPGSLPALLGEFCEQVFTGQVTPRLSNLIKQDLREGKMLEKCDDIGKGFVEGQHVNVTWIHEAGVHAVEQGMRCFMSNNIVREAVEDHATGKVVTRIG